MVRPEVMDWPREAKADLKHAKDSLKLSSYNWACFVGQQSCEKDQKALIMGFARRRPSHVHDLTKLYTEAEECPELSEDVVQTSENLLNRAACC